MHAQRWLSTIPSLSEHKLKVSFARAELYRANADELADDLNEICQLAELSQPTAREVLTAFVPLLTDVCHLERIGEVRDEVLAAQHLAAGRLLRCSTPEGHMLDPHRSFEASTVMQRADGKPLSLGERRALARRPSRATLDKLMGDPHPMVIKIVLANPRITEEDVVRMAAHRPAVPNVVSEIATAWGRHARVRMTVVFNPGSPSGVSVPLLTLLGRPGLLQVTRATDLPAVVRATARDLFELRPPLPDTDPPPMPH